MTDEMPDFDAAFMSPPADAPKAAKKRRKKPSARKVAVRVAPAPKKRVVKKRKAAKKARRGRPLGSSNKPKARAAPEIAEVKRDLGAFTETILGRPLASWQLAALEHFIKESR